MRIAWQLKSKFATYTTLGFVILISLQALINLAVATGLAPTKGLGLPFISYGNTSLVCNLLMVGILIRMVYETK
jgi:cell division protein FtsW